MRAFGYLKRVVVTPAVYPRSVIAFSTLPGTSSLGKPVMGLKVRYFGLVSAFSPLRVTVSLGRRAFSPLRAMFSLGKSVFCLCEGRFRFAFPSHVFTRFRVVIPYLLRRFRSVNALTAFRATISLGKRVIAFASDVYCLASVEFSPGYRVFAIWTRLRSLISVFAR